MSFVCATMFGAFTSAQAADPPATPQPTRAGVIDLHDVLRAHPKMNADMKALEENSKIVLANIVNKAQKSQEESKVLLAMKPGSAEYIAKNDEFIMKARELESERTIAQRDHYLKNVRIVYDAYKSVQAEIDALAPKYGFSVIVDNKTVDPKSEDPSLAEFAVTQSVVWSNPAVDLTNPIIKALNARYGKEYLVVCTIDANNVRTYSTANSAASLGTTPRVAEGAGVGNAANTAQPNRQPAPAAVGGGARPAGAPPVR